MYSVIAVSRCPVCVGPPHAEYNSVNVFMIRLQLRRLHVRRGKSNDIGRRSLGLRDKHGERNDAAMAARLRAFAYVLIVAHFQTQPFFQQARERQAVAESNTS